MNRCAKVERDIPTTWLKSSSVQRRAGSAWTAAITAPICRWPEVYVEMLENLRRNGALDRALVSWDAGWYWVGEPHGGTFRPYDTVLTGLVPALKAAGFSAAEIDALFILNPANALSIEVRRQRP